MQLPAVVSKLYKAINRNGGVTYVHCTAGLGRAPAVAVGSSPLSPPPSFPRMPQIYVIKCHVLMKELLLQFIC